jgi:phage tail tube protein FII
MDRLIRGANWYCQQTNQRLRIEETILPDLQREMLPFVLGGGFFGLELPAESNPLSCEQSINGAPEDLKSRYGREPGDWTDLRFYQSLLNVFPAKSNGEVAASGKPTLMGRVVFLTGLLNGYTEAGVKGMKATGPTRLRWSSIVLYHDMMNGRTIHKFDLQNNILIINGVNYSAEHNQLIAA